MSKIINYKRADIIHHYMLRYIRAFVFRDGKVALVLVAKRKKLVLSSVRIRTHDFCFDTMLDY
jgi:hypothetical protein